MSLRPPTKPRGVYHFTLVLVKIAARIFLKLSARNISGREHIPPSGGFILASNHASHLDPPILAVASPRQMTYLAKIELFSNPLFAKVIGALGAFPIRRGAGDREAFDLAVNLLRQGYALVVFPEGTRTHDGRLQRIRIGAAMMALAAGVPIVPARIEGSFAAWPKGGRIRPARVIVRIGPALKSDDLEQNPRGARALTARLTLALESLGRSSPAVP